MPAAIDLTGKRFGRLVALEKLKKGRRTFWRCQCDCGNEHEVVMDLLRTGKTKSCGCLRRETTAKTRLVKEKVGTRFGKLVVLKASDELSQRYAKWLCQCDCGKTTTVSGKALRNGNTQSCGCGIAEGITRAHAIDVTGQRFGRLVAVEPVVGARFKNGKAKRRWRFECDCGGEAITTVAQVRFGMTRSCGCLASEQSILNYHSDGHRAYAEDPEYAERPCFIYLVEILSTFDKIGIAFDLKKRFSDEASAVWWTREMPRACCWAVEQVALKATFELRPKVLPDDFQIKGGLSELRDGLDIEDTIEMLEDFSDQVVDIGWR